MYDVSDTNLCVLFSRLLYCHEYITGLFAVYKPLSLNTTYLYPGCRDSSAALRFSPSIAWCAAWFLVCHFMAVFL